MPGQTYKFSDALIIDIQNRYVTNKKDIPKAIGNLQGALAMLKTIPGKDAFDYQAEVASNLIRLLDREKNPVNNNLKTSLYPLVAEHATSPDQRDVRAQALVHIYQECKGNPAAVNKVAAQMAEMMVKSRRGDEYPLKQIKDLLKDDPELRKAMLSGLARGKGEAGVKEARMMTQSTALGSWLNSQASWGDRLSEFLSSKSDSKPQVNPEGEAPRMRSPGR